MVPGYYHRRSASGDMENSTCCNNTASEHYMMGRLIVDDLVHWATTYKVCRDTACAHTPLWDRASCHACIGLALVKPAPRGKTRVNHRGPVRLYSRNGPRGFLCTD